LAWFLTPEQRRREKQHRADPKRRVPDSEKQQKDKPSTGRDEKQRWSSWIGVLDLSSAGITRRRSAF
jgi:hypothetical protein